MQPGTILLEEKNVLYAPLREVALIDTCMEFNDVIRNRYSCLAFAERGVEKEKLDHILEVGRIEGLETMVAV